MITVVHVIGTLELGGAQMMLWKLLSRMDRQRFRNVVVCAFEEGPLAEQIRAMGIPVHDLRMRYGDLPPGNVRKLVRMLKLPGASGRFLDLLRRVEPDLIMTWGYHVDILGLLGASMVRSPVIWTVFSSFNPFFGRLFSAMNSVAVRTSGLAAAVVTDSMAGQDWHIQLGYRPKEWHVISMGFDIELFKPDEPARYALRRELDLPPDALIVGLVGRFNPVKGHHTFLQAAGLLGQQQEHVYFVLIGPGITAENAELWSWVEQSGVRDRVYLLGERSDVPHLTAALDIATCSSYGESFPNIVGEAMACAVPCVVTDVGDAARMVADTGLVVPPRDAEAMAEAWQVLIDLGSEGRQDLGRRARARVEAIFSLDQVVHQYEELCERLAALPRGLARRLS